MADEDDRRDAHRQACLSSLALVATAILMVAGVALPASGQKVPCPSVVREMHRIELRNGNRAPTAELVAKSLGTSAAWVERCAETYGRRLQVDELASDRRERYERDWESNEAEEVGREERETADDVVVDVIPRYRDKRRQRGFRANEQDWLPEEHDPWEPNAGRQWSPYLYDPYRTEPDDLEGVVRD